MASSRLRRTFAYPSSDSDSEAERGLDSTDQAELLTTLTQTDASSTRTYTLLLLAFPLAPALMHIPLLTDLPALAPATLAITSFLASAYALYFLPLPPVRVGVLVMGNEGQVQKKKRAGGYAFPRPEGQGETRMAHVRPAVPFVSDEVAELFAKYIVPANAAICVLLAVLELVKGRSWGDGVVVGGGYLPGVVFGVIMWARRELRVLDVGELEKLRKR